MTRTGANALELSAQKVQTAQKCDSNHPLMCFEGVRMTNWQKKVARIESSLPVIDHNVITTCNLVVYPKRAYLGFHSDHRYKTRIIRLVKQCGSHDQTDATTVLGRMVSRRNAAETTLLQCRIKDRKSRSEKGARAGLAPATGGGMVITGARNACLVTTVCKAASHGARPVAAGATGLSLTSPNTLCS